MACPTAQLAKRPQEQPLLQLLYHVIVSYSRGPFFAAAITGLLALLLEEGLVHGKNDALLFTILIVSVHMVVFWSMCGFFHFAASRGYLKKIRIHRSLSQQPSDSSSLLP